MATFRRERLPSLSPTEWAAVHAFFARDPGRKAVEPHELVNAAALTHDAALALLSCLAADKLVILKLVVYHSECERVVHVAPLVEGWPRFPLECEECNDEVSEDEALYSYLAEIVQLPQFAEEHERPSNQG